MGAGAVVGVARIPEDGEETGEILRGGGGVERGDRDDIAEGSSRRRARRSLAADMAISGLTPSDRPRYPKSGFRQESESSAHAECNRGSWNDRALHPGGIASVKNLRFVEDIRHVHGEREAGSELIGHPRIHDRAFGAVKIQGGGSQY